MVPSFIFRMTMGDDLFCLEKDRAFGHQTDIRLLSEYCWQSGFVINEGDYQKVSFRECLQVEVAVASTCGLPLKVSIWNIQQFS